MCPCNLIRLRSCFVIVNGFTLQDPSSSRSASSCFASSTNENGSAARYSIRRGPPPQGHKNPTLIFPSSCGPLSPEIQLSTRFPSISLIPALRRKFVFRSLHLFFNCQYVFHHFRPSPISSDLPSIFRFLPQIPGMCCPADSPPEMLSPDSTRHRPKSRQLNFSICIRLFCLIKLPSFVQI